MYMPDFADWVDRQITAADPDADFYGFRGATL